MKKRPYILTIAGFDPSGGAGILADIKTFEGHQCTGLAVQTANTVQTEDAFLQVNWVDDQLIEDQLTTLLNRYRFDVVKIGLIRSLEMLKHVIVLLKTHNAKVKIVWDPVLSASAGFDFKHDLSAINAVLDKIDVVTPNWNEIRRLTGCDDGIEGGRQLAGLTTVYLKGGHNEKALGKDWLFYEEKQVVRNPKPGRYFEKHGSGCVFASALAANLARGYTLHKSTLKAKRYIERFLAGNNGLLGKHYE